jgi:hypothetical protein
MVAEAITAVPVTAAVKTWAAEVTDTPVYRGFADSEPLPQIRVSRFGGPDESCLFQFDVLGDHGTVVAVETLAATLASALTALSSYSADGVLLHGARWDDSRWAPDSTTDRPRFIVTATFTATAATAAQEE